MMNPNDHIKNMQRQIDDLRSQVNILTSQNNLRNDPNRQIPFDSVNVFDKVTWDKVFYIYKSSNQTVTTVASTLLFQTESIVDEKFYSVSSSVVTFKVAGRYLIGYSIGGYRSAGSSGWMIAYPYAAAQLPHGQTSLHGEVNGLRNSSSTAFILDVTAGYSLRIVVDSTVNNYILENNYCNFWAIKLKPGDIQ